jgi:hypothetical protein
VDSDQCGVHGKLVNNDGPNQVWEKLSKPGNRNRVTYGDIKDGAPIERPPAEEEYRVQVRARAQAEFHALEEELHEATLAGQNTTELVARVQAALAAVTNAGRSRNPVEQPAPVAAPPVPAGMHPIYKGGLSANAKTAGDEVLDAKARSKPNEKKKKGNKAIGSKKPKANRYQSNLTPVTE